MGEEKLIKAKPIRGQSLIKQSCKTKRFTKAKIMKKNLVIIFRNELFEHNNKTK